MTRVGIVGGGITGLALHHHLRERGVESVVFEAAEAPGGVIRSERVDGRLLEYGPQRMRLTDGIEALVGDLGLGDELVRADDAPLYVYVDGELRRVPYTVREFIATDVLSWPGKLRLFAEPLTGAGDPDEMAADYLSRKFGDEVYRNVVGPLFGGIFGSDPARMPVGHALEGLLRAEEREGSLLKAGLKRLATDERPPAATFAEGMQRLPEALAARHAERVRLSTPVESVEGAGDGYALVADGETRVDEVVVTTRAPVSASLVEGIDPDSARALRRLNYNPLAIVHLASGHDAEGFGYQIRPGEGFDTLGVSWNASIFGRDGVFTCFLGGMHAPDVVERPDAAIGETAREEFEAVTGADAEVLDVTRLELGFPAYDRSWDALDAIDLPDGIRLATNYTARMGIPGRVREAAALAEEFA